jgi:hypothetical protein
MDPATFRTPDAHVNCHSEEIIAWKMCGLSDKNRLPLLNKSKAEERSGVKLRNLCCGQQRWDLLVRGAAGIRDLRDLRNRERPLRRGGTARRRRAGRTARSRRAAGLVGIRARGGRDRNWRAVDANLLVKVLGQIVSRAGQLVSASGRTGQRVAAGRAVETSFYRGLAAGFHARTRLRTAGLVALGRAAARLTTLTTCCAAVLGNDPSCREQQDCEQENFRHT